MYISESSEVRGERRGVVDLREKWAISGIPDLTGGEPGWGVLGIRHGYITVF